MTGYAVKMELLNDKGDVIATAHPTEFRIAEKQIDFEVYFEDVPEGHICKWIIFNIGEGVTLPVTVLVDRVETDGSQVRVVTPYFS